MELLDALKHAQNYEKGTSVPEGPQVRLAIVTNFTDDILKKSLAGLSVAEGIKPTIYNVGYKQYLFELKDPNSGLARADADITFFFFDANPYLESEFTADKAHLDDLWGDLRRYAEGHTKKIVIHTLAAPSRVQHHRLLKDHALLELVGEFNRRVHALAEEFSHVSVVDTGKLVARFGERHARDMRALYAFSQPFSNDFLFEVAKEWMTFVRAKAGKTRKALVLDLDNTLWGGIVGETGPLGVALGPDYPGVAFREFQRVIRDLAERGVILAINSRNNHEDVAEVFEKNPHMLLKNDHFSARQVNWNDKATNLRELASDLNIGLDSMVFIDDDAVNRDLVRSQHPEVLVPEWSLPPEEYAAKLLDLDAFHGGELTKEDRERGKMYQDEEARKKVLAEAPSMEEYLATLSIEIDLHLNPREFIPRLAQLTQKTNQWNLTTLRFTEEDVTKWIENGSFVFAGDVRDKFGGYGVTVLAVMHPKEDGETLELETFLMSCRVMGRRVEESFFREAAKLLLERGYKRIDARYIPTAKNAPVSEFLPSLGAQEKKRTEDGEVHYVIDLPDFLSRTKEDIIPISVKTVIYE